MPTMADITVKKYDGVTDIVYTKQVPSSADGSKARWICSAASAIRAFRHSLDMWSVWNGPKTARKVFGDFRYRVTYVESTTGLTKLLAEVPISFVATIPVNLTSVDTQEASSQALNLFASALVKSCVNQGDAPV